MYSYSKSTGGFYAADVHATRPPDAVEVSEDAYVALMAAQAQGKQIVGDPSGAPTAVSPVVPAPTQDQIKAALMRAVQAHLDATAQALGYDDIKSAVTYADEPAVPKFEAEGKALRAWRSQVWAQCIGLLAAVTAGTAPVPTAPQLLAQLPAFTAP